MSETESQSARDLFDHLRQDYWHALLRLQELRVLFGNKSDVALLNAVTGGPFLYDVQQAFVQDLLLRLCRLNDPAETQGHPNRSLAALAERMKNEGSEGHAYVARLANEAKKRSAFARPWRNKVFAHSDANLARDHEEGQELPEATLRKVDCALVAVSETLEKAADMLNEAVPEAPDEAMRAKQCIHRARCLAEAVKFLDGVISREGETDFYDEGAAEAFLRTIGREPTQVQVDQVVALREAATWFSA